MKKPKEVATTWTEIFDDQVFVFVRGRLVYKKWLKTGVSATFHINPSGVRWNFDKKTYFS